MPSYSVALFGLASFVGVFAACVGFRCFFTKEYRQTTLDLFVALVAAGVVLLGMGQIESFTLSRSGITLTRVVSDALNKPAGHITIDSQLPIDQPVFGDTIDANDIKKRREALQERLKVIQETKAEAVVIPMNNTYNPDAMTFFFDGLSKVPSFKYLVIADEDGNFFGLIPAEPFLAWWRSDTPKASKEFEKWLTDKSKANNFSSIPGFLTEKIERNTPKVTALELMTQPTKNYSILPVVENGKFVGVADRSRIVASVLVDIDKGLAQGK